MSDEAHDGLAELHWCHKEIANLRAEIFTMQMAIQRYGLHTWDCAHNDSKGEEPCDCGWKELLDKCHGMQPAETSA